MKIILKIIKYKIQLFISKMTFLWSLVIRMYVSVHKVTRSYSELPTRYFLKTTIRFLVKLGYKLPHCLSNNVTTLVIDTKSNIFFIPT